MQWFPKSGIGWLGFVLIPFKAYVAFAYVASGLKDYHPEEFPGSIVLFPLSLLVLVVGGIIQILGRARINSVITFGFAAVALSLCYRLSRSLAS